MGRTRSNTKRQNKLCLVKQFVQVGGRRTVTEEIECAMCFDFSRCPQKCAPCCEREPCADRDATHTEISEFRRGKLLIKSGDEDIDGFRCDRLYDICNFLRHSNRRCIETMG